MTHVSKYPLEKDVYFQIIDSLIWLLADIKSEDLMRLFINDFFTKTEKVMLAKRLTIAMMITQGYETSIITQVLKVSTGTIYRMQEWVDHGGKGIDLALKKLAHRDKMKDFLSKIDSFIEDLTKRSATPRTPKYM